MAVNTSKVDPFAPLHKQTYLSLTTYRKNGDPVPTPVWFAQEGDKIYVMSQPGAGKLKRIAHTPRVTMAACTLNGAVIGAAVEGTARIMDAGEANLANRALNRKYGWQKRIFDVYGKVTRTQYDVFIEIRA